MVRRFFCELYTEEYANEIVKIQESIEVLNYNGISRLKDSISKYYNVTDGCRMTVSQPDLYDRSIYMVGPSVMIGLLVEDSYTIASCLQKKMNDFNISVRVVNYGVFGNRLSEITRILETKLKEGDVVVFFEGLYTFKNIPTLNIMDIMEKRDVSEKWIADWPTHGNHKVNQMIADAIYDALKNVIDTKVTGDEKVLELDSSSVFGEGYIRRYFSNFKPENYDKIGSIVMNCNPFTKGHRYLIEQALKKVDFLIIFVVEEDRSDFTFIERFTMVCEGVKDIGERIMVVPSGECILSQKTFPEYFVKVADEDIVRNVEYDITLFAEQIAPALNIKYRFVGEEPDDVVTNEYNSAMKRILPKNGIELIEIPRKQYEGGNICATHVRKWLAEGDETKLDMLVPESTKKILFMNE